MHIRLIESVSAKELVRLALSIPDARLLSGWMLQNGEPLWQTLVLNQANSIGKSISGLQSVLATRTETQTVQGDKHPPFTTGVCCHFTYEAAELIEESITLQPASDQVPILSWLVCEASISTHSPSGKTYIYATTKLAADNLEALLQAELTKLKSVILEAPQTLKIESDVSKDEFKSQVRSVQERILAGDFFQTNLTRMLHADIGSAPHSQLVGFAERLLTQSQARFGAILNFENATVISASPERFFRIEPSPDGRRIFAEPIKGTRPRDEDPELDEALKIDLLNSEKDRAENIMIADLVRNDLSQVCTDESISADPVCELHSFKNVHHLVTRVSGILRDEISNLDALLAQFPCGSITGAPKWAAMDAIAELEQRGRGIYCGTIGYFDDRGHADFSVAIRTAVASFNESGTTLSYGTGGGITTLSDPEEEYQETIDKAAVFFEALRP